MPAGLYVPDGHRGDPGSIHFASTSDDALVPTLFRSLFEPPPEEENVSPGRRETAWVCDLRFRRMSARRTGMEAAIMATAGSAVP
jgi:hypothetical protein